MLTPRWHRNNYLDYMAGRRVERPMFCELFGPLVGLPDEWRAQGASESEIDLTAFGFDYVERIRLDVAHGYWPLDPEKFIHESDDLRVYRDGMGRTMKLAKGRATLPLPMDFPVANESDWARIKNRYEFHPERFTDGWAHRASNARDAGGLVVAKIVGGYDQIRQLMGDEEACVSFYTQPDLIRDMLRTFERLNHELLSRIVKVIPVDQLSIHEDFAGKTGPLLGPNIMDEFLAPYYAAGWNQVCDHGAEIFQLDSDGNITPILDSILAGSVNSILPNEPAAGMDIVRIRERYGERFRLVGGIDKFAVRTSREAIDAELEYKLGSQMQIGGVVFGLDHRIPNGTPLELYRYYVRRTREILGLDPDPQPGWGRMGF